MIKCLKVVFLALACTFVFVGCAKTGPSTGPGRKEIQTVETTLNGNYSKAQVKKAILNTTAKRKWTTAARGGDVIRATYAKEAHKVVVDITYSAKKISVSYVDSTNLNYQEKNGVRTIHSNYYRWVGNIGSDVKIILGDF